MCDLRKAWRESRTRRTILEHVRVPSVCLARSAIGTWTNKPEPPGPTLASTRSLCSMDEQTVLETLGPEARPRDRTGVVR